MSNINFDLDKEKRLEGRMTKNARQRDFVFAKESGLLAFGNDLFKGGYDFSDFAADVAMIKILPLDASKEYYEKLLEKYNKIASFLTYDQIVSLTEKNNYLDNIKMGYEYQERQIQISKGSKKH